MTAMIPTMIAMAMILTPTMKPAVAPAVVSAPSAVAPAVAPAVVSAPSAVAPAVALAVDEGRREASRLGDGARLAKDGGCPATCRVAVC